MHANRAIFHGAVVGGLAENGDPNIVLSQFVAVSVESTLDHVGQKLAEATGFLERSCGQDALNQLPTRIFLQSVSRFGCLGQRTHLYRLGEPFLCLFLEGIVPTIAQRRMVWIHPGEAAKVLDWRDISHVISNVFEDLSCISLVPPTTAGDAELRPGIAPAPIRVEGIFVGRMRDMAQRFAGNPLLRPSDIRPGTEGMEVTCLLNPGAFRFAGRTWLLLRVAERPLQEAGKTSFPVLDANKGVKVLTFNNADPRLDLKDPRVIRYDGRDYLTTMSHLRLVASEDGVHFSEADGYGAVFGEGELETFGIEDCRVTKINDVYFLTYTQVSENGVGVGLRSTQDWKSYRSRGMIFPPHNKDCTLFPERLGGSYYALHRPSSPELGGNYIWIAESPDLEHWGNHRCIAHTRGGRWDSARVGAGASPIKTDRGWLEIYHGANRENRYCLGVLLLDLEKPWRVIARSEEPVMEPFAPYERNGFFGEVIFTNGHIVDKDVVTMYYGAADSVVCAARFSIRALLDSVLGRQGSKV